jgi:predicted SprT family Zn-dependent metalloprotease
MLDREAFVLELMNDALKSYGIHDYKTKLSQGTKTIGYVNHTAKDFGISKYWAVCLPDDALMNTILHEVAHILVWNKYGRWATPHGPEWKAIARSIGCDGVRCLIPSYVPGLNKYNIKVRYQRIKESKKYDHR